MLITFTLGTILWLIYGILIRSMPVAVANAATLLLTLTILALKIYYR